MKIIRQTANPREKRQPPPQPGRTSCFNSPAGILKSAPTAKKDSSSANLSLLLPPQPLLLLKKLTWIPHDLSPLPEKTTCKGLSQRPPGKPCPQLTIRDVCPSALLKKTNPINLILDNSSLAPADEPQKPTLKPPSKKSQSH
jgi:hypothetical protein